MKVQLFKILGYLQIFVGVSAVSGALPMLLNPNGSSQGLTLEALQNTPFASYFIPGLILLLVNGIGSLIASYFSLKLKIAAGILGVLFGIGLIIWMVTQFILIGYSNWLQPFYLTIGFVELLLGLSIYRKSHLPK